jgi:deoxyribodipyrimidine photolyase-related protein
MSHATVIYPHQLFWPHPALTPGRPVFLIEEPLFINEFPTHRQKALLHRLSLKAYAEKLTAAGYQVTYLENQLGVTTKDHLKTICAAGYSNLHIVDITDNWLERRITETLHDTGTTRTWYESPLFILPKAEAIERYQKSKRHMARFYQSIRTSLGILLEADGAPTGDAWSFDSENRQKLPKHISLPTEPTFTSSNIIVDAQAWLSTQPGEFYGEDHVWLPYSHEAAEQYLTTFLTDRFTNFGPYEDAVSSQHTRLFHSTLSPLINIGLLTPEQVVTAALTYARMHDVPLPSLEGFIRQIIGWREFIRAAYEVDGTTMRTKNFWNHSRTLPSGFWDGTTGINPLDDTIKKSLRHGYTHHIERLMIAGNFMLLSEIHPDQVYRWFMAMYVDAYDWVMVPNVYGMSQFADGGLFATKPYISGSNYIRKMSDYKPGEWSVTWDALYWNFIHTHQDFFLKNHRLSMMPRLLANMPEDKRNAHLKIATNYLTSDQPETDSATFSD